MSDTKITDFLTTFINTKFPSHPLLKDENNKKLLIEVYRENYPIQTGHRDIQVYRWQTDANSQKLLMENMSNILDIAKHYEWKDVKRVLGSTSSGYYSDELPRVQPERPMEQPKVQRPPIQQPQVQQPQVQRPDAQQSQVQQLQAQAQQSQMPQSTPDTDVLRNLYTPSSTSPSPSQYYSSMPPVQVPESSGGGDTPIVLSGALNSLSSEISQLENKTQQIDNVIGALNSNALACRQVKRVSAELRQKILQLEKENNLLNTKLDFYNKEIEKISKRLNSINEQILKYRNMEGTEEQVKSLENERDKTIDDIKKIEDKVENVEDVQEQVKYTQGTIEDEKTGVDIVLISLKEDQQGLKKIYSSYLRRVKKINKEVNGMIIMVEKKGSPRMKKNMNYARKHASAFGLI